MVAGADVNLAARLCAAADVNELVLTSRVWEVMKHSMGDRQVVNKVYSALKGFDREIPAVHLDLQTILMITSFRSCEKIRCNKPKLIKF